MEGAAGFRTPCLSVVVPVYNSSEILPSLHARLSAVLRALCDDYELVLVDDDSTDASWQVLLRLADDDDHVTAVHLRRNAGYDNALLAGLRQARHEPVVVMDDDLQHAPEDIPALARALSSGYDVVYANFPRKRQSVIKNVGSWLNGRIAEIVLDKPRDLYLSPFKILRGEIVAEVVRYTGPYPYVDGFILRATSSISQLDVVHHDRASGHGHHGLLRSIRILLNFITTFSLLPLRIATIGGLVLSLLAALSGLALVLANLFAGVGLGAPGWTSIILVAIILGAAQLMAIGVVGEYVGRSYLSARPQYVLGDVASRRRRAAGDPSAVSEHVRAAGREPVGRVLSV
jgi:undecaprenyl-phosphate 4-deoxy-4-formamido-L-arabinose transferase